MSKVTKILIVVFIALSFGLGFGLSHVLSPASVETTLMIEVYNLLDEYYVNREDITPELLTSGSVDEMLEVFGDPYTHHLSIEEYAWLQEYFGDESPSIYSELIESDIAYIKIDHFSESTDDDLIAFLQTVTGLNGIILDLRDNPGGLIDSAVEVADQFLDGGIILSIVDGDGSEELLTAEPGGVAEDPELKIAVLVNGPPYTDVGSASAAEMVAGALQDSDGPSSDRVCLIGTNSYGKGCMQVIVGLSDGSAVSITYAYWYTPDESWVTEGGLIPDLWIVDYPETEEVDEQLAQAISYVTATL